MSTAAEIIAAAIEEHTSSMSYSFPEDDALVILDALRKHDYTLVRMGRADHVHLARQTDGTVTATPMRHPAFYEEEHFVVPLWVDEVSS